MLQLRMVLVSQTGLHNRSLRIWKGHFYKRASVLWFGLRTGRDRSYPFVENGNLACSPARVPAGATVPEMFIIVPR